MQDVVVKRALISVSDKTGIVPFAQGLHALGIEILSTGGTAKVLAEAGIPVISVDSITDFPEMMDGRVKTLHPRLHGGILARRDIDAKDLDAHNIPAIDLVIVNLYPFHSTVTKPDCTLEKAIANIDIGGPAMIRAAAKNHLWVGVVVNPERYESLLGTLEQSAGNLPGVLRQQLCHEAFEHTAYYDSVIAQYFRSQEEAPEFPEALSLPFVRQNTLRYGENPHQRAAFYLDPLDNTGLGRATQHQGKALSFNNLADADAALKCCQSFTGEPQAACVIVKHANPCGVALGDTPALAYARAYAADPMSAFGGIIAFNQNVDEAAMDAILSQQFVEVIVATGFSEAALARAEAKPNVRLLTVTDSIASSGWDFKRLAGGLLVQSHDISPLTEDQWRAVTTRAPTPQESYDLSFAWRVCQQVKSNAIVYAKSGQTIGIGAGQMSRVFSAQIALEKAKEAGLSPAGSAMASDAFFPFPDSVEAAVAAGVTAIIQPGGAQRDEQVIEEANKHDIAMVMTGVRHFKH